MYFIVWRAFSCALEDLMSSLSYNNGLYELRIMLQAPFLFFLVKGLDLIADFEIIPAFEPHTAFGAAPHFCNISFQVLQ